LENILLEILAQAPGESLVVQVVETFVEIFVSSYQIKWIAK
jgi:hypothetical protein